MKQLALIVCAVILISSVAAWYLTSSPINAPEELNLEAIATVTWVSDGDTIGINITEMLVPHLGIYTGDDVVRFAGIDTEEVELNSHAIANHPELEEMTEDEYMETDYYAHAISAMELVENLCPVGSQVYLDIDELAHNGHPYRGYYGRIIAVVYVNIDGAWVNVNARVLHQEYPDYCMATDWFDSEFNSYDWLNENYQYL